MAFTSSSGTITGLSHDETNNIWDIGVHSPLARDGIIPEPAHNYTLRVYQALSPGWAEALAHLVGLGVVFHGHACEGTPREVAVLGMGLTPRSLLELRRRMDP